MFIHQRFVIFRSLCLKPLSKYPDIHNKEVNHAKLDEIAHTCREIYQSFDSFTHYVFTEQGPQRVGRNFTHKTY